MGGKCRGGMCRGGKCLGGKCRVTFLKYKLSIIKMAKNIWKVMLKLK